MSEPTTYEIVLRGRASARLLRPLIDDFTMNHTPRGTTRLIGDIRDPSHLHGVVAHLTSVNAEIISINPYHPISDNPSTTSPATTGPTVTGKETSSPTSAISGSSCSGRR